MTGEDVVPKVAGIGSKVSHILLDVVAPIGAFFGGLGMGDLFNLNVYISAILPKAISDNKFVKVPTAIAALVYFGLAYLCFTMIPMIGRTLGGLFAGCGLRSMFTSFQGGPLAPMAPA